MKKIIMLYIGEAIICVFGIISIYFFEEYKILLILCFVLMVLLGLLGKRVSKK